MTRVEGLGLDPVADSIRWVGCLHLLAPHAGRLGYTIGIAPQLLMGRGELAGQLVGEPMNPWHLKASGPA